MSQAAVGRRITFGDVLANREFRAMYIAQALSVVGDQLARIAVALLVFNRSHSAFLTALSYGLSFVPWIIAGPLLAGYADRLPRRSVMVFCDVVRAALVMCLAVPHIPLPAVFALLLLVALLEPPFTTARAALLPDVVGEDDAYTVAYTLQNTTNQFGAVVGFALGGVAVATIGARTSLALDALTFGISALLVLRAVIPRPAVDAGPPAVLEDLRQGLAIVFSNARLRWLVLMSATVIASVITTASIAVPYAVSHGRGGLTAGLLIAAMQLGVVTGALVVGRVLKGPTAERLMLPLALGTPLVFSITAANPPPWIAGIIWFVGGALSAVQILANRLF